MTDAAAVPVLVLCGGLGTRLAEETELRPKPMVTIGTRPILWHILRTYAHHGFRRFILCLGYKAEVIKSYFLDYSSLNSDFTIDLASGKRLVHWREQADDWQITLADTGQTAMTGARIARAAKYLGDAEHFAVTYGDGLTNADLAQELKFHVGHDRIGTVLGVNPPSRFGELKTDGPAVSSFVEKAELGEHWVNGGYFFFRRKFLSYLSDDDSCVLEHQPLSRLADDGQLCVFKHSGYWACMDTQRDRETLNKLWDSGHAPWTPPAPASRQPGKKEAK
jgi:glucose-1-phosphate cytidylyltransferase